MKQKLPKLILMLGALLPGLAASAVTEEDFEVKTTRNWINLCTASPQDPRYVEAINFCYGYVVGANHYYVAEHSNDPRNSFVCLPDPKPTRSQVVDLFVAWTKTHPQYLTDIPVDTQLRFLSEKWPCK